MGRDNTPLFDAMRLKKYEREAPHAYSFGVFPTLELLRFQPARVREVLVNASGERNEGIAKLRAACQSAQVLFTVDDKLVERLSPKENTYAIGVFEKYQPQLEADSDHVVLVSPSDMGNLGTTLRSLLGFGFRNLALVKPAADLFDPRVIRASMGALFQVNFTYFDSFESYRNTFRTHHLYPFMTDGAVQLGDVVFQSPFALVFGNESSGLPASFHDLGTSVSIAHTPAIDSLNLSVAIAIGLYEASKKR